jgi:hypothetical protein
MLRQKFDIPESEASAEQARQTSNPERDPCEMAGCTPGHSLPRLQRRLAGVVFPEHAKNVGVR